MSFPARLLRKQFRIDEVKIVKFSFLSVVTLKQFTSNLDLIRCEYNFLSYRMRVKLMKNFSWNRRRRTKRWIII